MEPLLKFFGFGGSKPTEATHTEMYTANPMIETALLKCGRRLGINETIITDSSGSIKAPYVLHIPGPLVADGGQPKLKECYENLFHAIDLFNNSNQSSKPLKKIAIPCFSVNPNGGFKKDEAAEIAMDAAMKFLGLHPDEGYQVSFVCYSGNDKFPADKTSFDAYQDLINKHHSKDIEVKYGEIQDFKSDVIIHPAPVHFRTGGGPISAAICKAAQEQKLLTPLMNLPKEIIQYVTSFLKPEEVASAPLVGKKMKKSVDDIQLWKQLAKKANVPLTDEQTTVKEKEDPSAKLRGIKEKVLDKPRITKTKEGYDAQVSEEWMGENEHNEDAHKKLLSKIPGMAWSHFGIGMGHSKAIFKEADGTYKVFIVSGYLTDEEADYFKRFTGYEVTLKQKNKDL